jgi:TPR repeat protein
VSYVQWADARLTAFAASAPWLARVKSRYEVEGCGWWGLAEEFRGTKPAAERPLHFMMVCFKSRMLHPESKDLLISLTVSATPEVFAADEDLYRWLLHWKVITCDIQETSETLATEYQEAQFQRGMAYLNGLGDSPEEKAASQDPEFAALWFRRAAEQGHAKAQYSLAVQYSKGEGVPEDIDQALAWCRQSAAQSHELAVKGVRILEARRRPKAFWSFFSKRK